MFTFAGTSWLTRPKDRSNEVPTLGSEASIVYPSLLCGIMWSAMKKRKTK